MFRAQAQPKNRLSGGFAVFELIYHCTVRQLRGSSSNAVVGLVMTVLKSMLMLTMFVFMFEFIGLRKFAIRGDFVLYVMSGVFMFMTHVSALGAVSRAAGPTSSMMMHAPMNPVVAVVSAALASLYRQLFSASVILFLYHSVWRPVELFDPVGVLGVFVLSWASGCAIGLMFYAVTPWSPGFVGLATMVYQRANMIASGKMLVANMSPPKVRSMFDWNPLFHIIDQARGRMFLNYDPRYTSLEYPVYTVGVFIMIGLMGQFFTRKYASQSWGKR